MAFPTTSVLDDFNRSNEGPPPSANWTDLLNGMEVVSNACKGDNGGDANVSLWDAATYGADCEAYLTITTRGSNLQLLYLFARCTTLNIATFDGYDVEYTVVDGVNNDTVIINRIDNGVTTQLGATITLEFANGDKLGIEAIGSTIKAYRCPSGGSWGDISSGGRSDSSYGSAGYVGLGCYSNTYVLDDFGGGTVVSPYDVTEQVGASADDANQAFDGSVTTTDDTVQTSSDGNWFGFRFQTVAIPAGATIDSAVLQLYLPDSAHDNVHVDIYGEDVDDAAAFTTGSNNISGRTLTTAKVDWDTNNAGAAGWVDSPDITSIIQEIVDRPGWASGQDMALILDCVTSIDLTVRFWDYTGNAHGAKLLVNYTEAAGLSKPIAMHYYRRRRQ
jgi:hypothetical protein